MLNPVKKLLDSPVVYLLQYTHVTCQCKTLSSLHSDYDTVKRRSRCVSVMHPKFSYLMHSTFHLVRYEWDFYQEKLWLTLGESKSNFLKLSLYKRAESITFPTQLKHLIHYLQAQGGICEDYQLLISCR